jgi:hypothetical protein
MADQLVQSNKEQYAKAVCMFLAEQLRTHKITLKRAAEIAKKVVENINLINSEGDFLNLIKELNKEFEELFKLEEKVFFNMQITDRKQMEAYVREFVIMTVSSDLNLAYSILSEAIKDEAKLTDLSQQFPPFSQFIQTK